MSADKPKGPSLRLSTDPPGYWLGQDLRAGFPDDPSLPLGARRRVAAWCARYAPERLTDGHREALAAPFTGEIAEAQRGTEHLGSYYWTPRELANRLGLELSEVHARIERGEIKAIRIGDKALRIPKDNVQQIIDAVAAHQHLSEELEQFPQPVLEDPWERDANEGKDP